MVLDVGEKGVAAILERRRRSRPRPRRVVVFCVSYTVVGFEETFSKQWTMKEGEGKGGVAAASTQPPNMPHSFSKDPSAKMDRKESSRTLWTFFRQTAMTSYSTAELL